MDWVHRFEDNFPVYFQISNGNCLLHLSEHHGDCSPGAAIRIEITNIQEYQSMLLSKNYKYSRPGINKTPWNSHEMTIIDPLGNRIVFYQYL